MEKLLTIVIPAYNMEKYLHRCLDSIIVDSVMDKVQVLIVNDGSKDRTSDIAHKYEAKYPHYIQVIDKENGNYGSCMNVGLSLAKGKYFRTLDSDDWYDKKAYENFVEKLSETDVDMIICERYVYDEKNNQTLLEVFPETITHNSDIDIKDVEWGDKLLMTFHTVNCIVYKTSILKRINMRWSEKVFYSDTEYNYFPLRSVETVRFMPYPVYCYFIGREDQSVSATSVRKNFNSFYIVSKRILDDFVKYAKIENPQYKLQKFHLIRILRFLYQSLLIDGYKNITSIKDIECLVKINEDILKSTSYIDVYRNYYYVHAYRYNKIKYFFIRLDYRLRTNRLIRCFFGKLSNK